MKQLFTDQHNVYLYDENGTWTFDADPSRKPRQVVRVNHPEPKPVQNSTDKKQNNNDEDEDEESSSDETTSSDSYTFGEPIINIKEIDIDTACLRAAKSLECDAIESTFAIVNENVEMYKDLKLISVSDEIKLAMGGDGGNGFIQACEIAWAKHYPLKIDPSHIWLCITQALALHVEENAEKLREKWIMHDGKKQLIVVREEFVKGT